MKMRRLKVSGRDSVYHVMIRTVNGELLIKAQFLTKYSLRIFSKNAFFILGNHEI